MILHPQDQDIDCLIWVSHALTPPNLKTIGVHVHQIHVEWFVPTSTTGNVLEIYNGWDTKNEFSENMT